MKTVLFLILLLIIPFAAAEQYHMQLLTVSENGEEWTGGTADMYLEIRPGNGRIFIDSFPLSRLDTQFSTRFANEIACDFLEEDCDKYDFFYTLRTESSVVGGPSAGTAITILTIAAIDKQELNEEVAITGTINSGGLVGPVAGIIAKSEAAKKAGLKKVLVPALAPLAVDQIRMNNLTNKTLNFSMEYDAEVIASLTNDEFEVIQINDLYEALPHFIDKEYPTPTGIFTVDKSYSVIMEEVAKLLCERRETLHKNIAQKIEKNATLKNDTEKMQVKIDNAFMRGDYYSAASFCFSQNIDYRAISLLEATNEQVDENLRALERMIFLNEEGISREDLETIGDIETYAIVKERLVEVEEALGNLKKNHDEDINQNISRQALAYALERAYSAQVWSAFFAMQSTPFLIDTTHLRDACLNKIGEAEERVSYVESYLPTGLTMNSREELQFAQRDRKAEEFALCLFKASKAKAEANILASALAVSEARLDEMIERKLHAAERVLSEQARHGLFPIMGYSYYEYARSLQEEQPYSALTFAEYALELSQLNLYFPEKNNHDYLRFVPIERITIFAIGVIIGALAVWFIFRKQ